MLVDFFVDPALAADPNTKEVGEITLSYTFFRSKGTDKAKDLSRFVTSAEPDPHRGPQLFAERCTAGPMLGGAFGRKAGAVTRIQLRCGSARFRHHLVGGGPRSLAFRPRVFIPGARMPVKIIDPAMRRDITAYLEEESKNARAPSAAASVTRSWRQ
jgi:cytochrome c oxidase assembly protein subunit 11